MTGKITIPTYIECGDTTLSVGAIFGGFNNGKELEEVVLPHTVREISRRTFTNCKSLQKLNTENVEFFEEYCILNTRLDYIDIRSTFRLKTPIPQAECNIRAECS